MSVPPWLLLSVGLVFTGSSGVLASEAVTTGTGVQERTVTVNVATGPRGDPGTRGPAGQDSTVPGPPGPRGPEGPPGTGIGARGICVGAPTGYEPGVLVFNAPGGQQIIWTCLGP